MTELAWYVAYTRVQGERRAAYGLAEQGIEVYLPQEVRWARHARRKTRVERPLFVRYLFVGLDASAPAFHLVRATDGIEGFISTCGTPSSVSTALVDKLKALQAKGTFDYAREPVKAVRGQFNPRQPVKIVAGALEGFDATVIRMLGRKNVRILYSVFGRPGEATVTADKLEALPVAHCQAA